VIDSNLAAPQGFESRYADPESAVRLLSGDTNKKTYCQSPLFY